MPRRQEEQAAQEQATQQQERQEAAPAVAPAAPTGDFVARTLALQQGVGNQAVSRLIAAGGPTLARRDPRRVDVEEHTADELKAMSLAEFHSFTDKQLDWRQSPAMMADRAIADELRTLLVFSEAGQLGAGPTADRPVVNACGEFKVSDLLAKSTVADRNALRSYSIAFAQTYATIPVDLAPDLAKAIEWGSAIRELEAALDPAVLNRTIHQKGGRTDLQNLIDGRGPKGGPGGNQVAEFADYVQRANPLLSADNGAEVRAFLLHAKVGQPVEWVGKVPHLRNPHHFEHDAVKALSDNWKNGNPGNLPFTLILHSAEDHNGAFHHDANLTAAITKGPKFTLMVEGMTSLAEAGDLVEELASKYGVGGKLRQIMIAGHGESNTMDLAAKEVPGGGVEGEAFAIDGPSADETKRLFKRILDSMEKGPEARVLLNACLTASHRPVDPTGNAALDPNAPVDELGSAAAIRAGVQGQPALADRLREMAAAEGFGADTINAANASFTSDAGLVDPATGQLGFQAPGYDLQLTAKDRLEYVRHGGEPEGAMRAVLELWAMAEHGAAGDPGHMPAQGIGPVGAHSMADLQKALDDRIGKAPARWDDYVIVALFKIVKANLTSGAIINQLTQVSCVRTLGHLKSNNYADVEDLRGVPNAFADEIYSEMFPAINGASKKVHLVTLQHWAANKAGRQGNLLSVLAGFTCREAEDILHFYTLEEWGLIDPLLNTVRAGDEEEGRLRLALFDATLNFDAMRPASMTLLRSLRNADGEWADEPKIRAVLGGRPSPEAVLSSIEEPLPPAGGGGGGGGGGGRGRKRGEDFNVDLDRRPGGRNDLYVEPMARTGAVTATRLNVREQPGMSHAVIGSLEKDVEVMLIGKVKNWYAIEFNDRMAFVYSTYVTVPANPL